MRFSKRLTAVVLPMLLAGCAANGPVLSQGVSAMRAGAAQAKSESGLAIADINASRRQFAIEEVLEANRPPKEDDFKPVIQESVIGKWNKAFDTFDEYFAALLELLSTERPQEAAANLKAIGEALQGEPIKAQLPTGSEQAIGEFGGFLIRAAQEKEALKAMRTADPAFGRVMHKMADLISGPAEKTLSSMVKTQWARRLEADAIAYTELEGGTREQRAAIITSYAKGLDERDAKLAALANLRLSLIALGEAHAQAAAGSNEAALYWIAQLQERLAQARVSAKGGGN